MPTADPKNTMWCSSCRQDVPGTLLPHRGQLCCPRCGEGIRSSPGADGLEPEPAEKYAPAHEPAAGYDEWEMEERLRHLERIYAQNRPRQPLSEPRSAHRFRTDAAHLSAISPHWNYRRRKRRRWTGQIGQASVTLGLAASVCGASLVAWAFFGLRPDLWHLGIPIAIAGQVFLLLGLALPGEESAREERSTASSQPAIQPRDEARRLRIDSEGHDPTATREKILVDLAVRLDELSKKLDREAG